MLEKKLSYKDIMDYCPFLNISCKKNLKLCKGNYGACTDYWSYRNEEEILLEKNG